MDEDKWTRATPPDPEKDEWQKIWSAIEKAEKSWLITGPIYAIVSNWKALAVVVAAAAWINKPEILQAITVLFGGAP